VEQHVASPTDEIVVERYLGRMIDINYHLVTEAGQPPLLHERHLQKPAAT
jgi:hypothetical protein